MNVRHWRPLVVLVVSAMVGAGAGAAPTPPGKFHLLAGQWSGQQIQVSPTGVVDPYQNRGSDAEGWVTPPTAPGESWWLHTTSGALLAVRPSEELSPTAIALSEAATRLRDLTRSLRLRPSTAGGPGIAKLGVRAQTALARADAGLSLEMASDADPLPAGVLDRLRDLCAAAQQATGRAASLANAEEAAEAARQGAASAASAFQSLVSVQTDGAVVLEPATIDFGDVKIGTISAPKVVTLTNNTKAAIQLDRLYVPPRAPFEATAVKDVVVQPGGTATLSITFNPTRIAEAESGAHAELRGKPGLAQALTGRGVGDFSLPRQEIGFGEVKLGAFSEKEVVITNHTGGVINAELQVGSNRKGFTVNNSAQVQLPANGTATVTLRFTPTKIGLSETMLTVRDTQHVKSFAKVGLLGRGIENVALDPDPNELIIRTTPGVPVLQEVTLWNTTDQPVVGMIDRSQVSRTYFTFLGDQNFNIPPQGSHTFSVYFQATGKCTHKSKAFFFYGAFKQPFPINAVSR